MKLETRFDVALAAERVEREEAHPADVEKLRSFGTIAAHLADGYMPRDIAGSGRSGT
jgi:hypothetical protein